MNATSWAGLCAGLLGSAALVWTKAERTASLEGGPWNTSAVQGAFEMAVPAHNDLSFRYVLENRTGSEYRIRDAAGVRILARSKTTGRLMPSSERHLSAEVPLTLPPGRPVHFAVIWTAENDFAPDADDFPRENDIGSLVIFDVARRIQIELPASR